MIGAGKVVFSFSQWQALTTPASASYRPGLAAATVTELLGLAGLVAFSAVLIELYFRKKRAFPKLYCIKLVATAAFLLIDEVAIASLLGSESDTKRIAELARAVVVAAIWVSYLQTSKRVAATFVH
jgi:Protein of unknown function (DUF2569)